MGDTAPPRSTRGWWSFSDMRCYTPGLSVQDCASYVGELMHTLADSNHPAPSRSRVSICCLRIFSWCTLSFFHGSRKFLAGKIVYCRYLTCSAGNMQSGYPVLLRHGFDVSRRYWCGVAGKYTSS